MITTTLGFSAPMLMVAMKQAKKAVKEKNRCMGLMNRIVNGLQMYRIKHAQEKKVTASIYYILYHEAGEELSNLASFPKYSSVKTELAKFLPVQKLEN